MRDTSSSDARIRSHAWHDIPPHGSDELAVTVVVETPANSRNKYELDKHSGLFKLDRVLHSSVHYPGDYGFIPQTLFEDGDPLDALLLIKEPTFTGCIVQARPIGVLRMVDRGEPDDKILAVPVHDPSQSEYFDIRDIPQHTLREVEYFFATYKVLENKHVEVLKWEGEAEARKEVARSITLYATRYGVER